MPLRPERLALGLNAQELRQLYEVVDSRCQDYTELLRPGERPPSLFALRDRLQQAIERLRQLQAEAETAPAGSSDAR